jgi:hypothetical protein
VADQAPRRQIPTLYLVAGGGVLVLAFYLYKRQKDAAAAAAAAAGGASTTSTAGTAAGTYDPEAATIQNLQDEIQNLQGPPSTSLTGSTYTPPTGESLSGGGYAPGKRTAAGATIADNQGNLYAQILGAKTLAELNRQNVPRFYQPVPGVFEPVTATTAPGTPQFLLVGSAS